MINEFLDVLCILIQRSLQDYGQKQYSGTPYRISSLQAKKMFLIQKCVIASLFTDASNYNPLQLFIPSEYPVPGSSAVEQQTRYPKNEDLFKTPMLPGLCMNASPNTG